ncbi:putative monooxygenase [Hyaloraphidium curvatum]|nr:putative monooxygenase [Hyaloraphidium curvatum]
MDCDAVVVGAGFAGLYALHRLRESGLSVVGLEAAPDVGGTWYWNRYPGVRCDVPSLLYSYSWSPELRRDWRWSEKFAARAEILQYVSHAADRFRLRDLIKFETRVTAAAWDEATARWTVRTDKGDVLRARFCILATGALSVPNTPDIPGKDSFAGAVYHTAKWPHEPVDFSGMRVGVVGTGSSGVQAIPLIAEAAAHLTVFQRTPNFSMPSRNRPLTEEDHVLFEKGFEAYRQSFEHSDFGRVPPNAATAPVPPRDVQWQRYEQLWQEGGGGILYAFPNILTHHGVNDVACEFVRQKIRDTVHDPRTAEDLCPTDHPLGVKRICVDTGYYQTFNRPNVALVNLRREPIERIVPDGVNTAARHIKLDAIVFATGFDAVTGALLAIDITGRGGRTLKQAWAEGPQTYLGLTVAGFPNLFCLTGPQSPSVIGNVITNGEHHVDWLIGCLGHMRERNLRTVEPEEEAQRAWVEHVADVASRTLFPEANSWYRGVNIPGKPKVFMPYVGAGYRHTCARIAAEEYRGFRFDATGESGDGLEGKL